jgi:ABC-type nitrate/sulfonate/bicarbonate transport system substrate-binding protein
MKGRASMPLIPAKKAVDVFVNNNGRISICHPDDQELVEIHREDVDAIIKALQESAKWIDENPHEEDESGEEAK